MPGKFWLRLAALWGGMPSCAALSTPPCYILVVECLSRLALAKDMAVLSRLDQRVTERLGGRGEAG